MPLAEPTYEATVSPKMVALLYGKVGAESEPRGNLGTDNADKDSEAYFQIDEPFSSMALRRDGQRPLSFLGTLLWEHAATWELGQSSGQKIASVRRIFLTTGSNLIAQVIHIPSDGLAARPVHRALEFDHETELTAFFSSTGLDLCFAVSPSFNPELARINAQFEIARVPIRSLRQTISTTS